MTKEKAADLLNKRDSLNLIVPRYKKQNEALSQADSLIRSKDDVILKQHKIIKEKESLMFVKDKRIEALKLASDQYYDALIENRKQNKRIKRSRTWIIVGAAVLVGVAGYVGYQIGK